MSADSDLAARLQALSRGDTMYLPAPAPAVAQRLDSVRRALRRQAVPDPTSDYLLVCAAGSEHWAALGPGTVVGTAPDVGLPVASKFVSAHHCRLSETPDGWVVEDLGSKNGVCVNGQRVSRCSLCNGDAVQLADVALILVLREEPSPS